ncbi:MAG TPA: hypothetical protein VFU02_01585 [Polyangiaceae bacterium]|nr:hypothetical protein [Polyangiaceae bacterium]
MFGSRRAAWAVVCLMTWGCGEPAEQMETGSIQQELAGEAALGRVPSGLPARLQVGLFEEHGQTWMKSSGADWDMRYRYFTKGWADNWGWGAYDGGWGLGYMQECDEHGYIPVVQYYQLFGEAGGGESSTLTKVQNKSTMASYFGDFKLLMQRAKDFGKPVVVLLEADGFGFLEQQTNHDPNTYAAVADSGMPELNGLPNSVAGWGLAFLAIKKAVGANNAVLGLHISGWASGKDIAHSNVTEALQPEVDKVYGFLGPAGLASNVTGTTYDVLVGDPLDRDADYYRIERGGDDRWWDTSDSASINSKSFNRYAEWLRLWNAKSSKRWILWQIPLGNSASKNVWNNGNPGEGYKDNRAEYFFAGDTKHLQKFADAGVIALLFGAGAGGVSSYANDTYTDGKLFMQSRAGSFLNAGGLAIDPGDDTGTGSTSTTSGSTTGGSTTGGSTTGGYYDFEDGTEGWVLGGDSISSVSRSTSKAYSGEGSLRVKFNGTAGTQLVYVPNPGAPAGAVVTLRVYVPGSNKLTSVQPYVLQGSAGGWAWTGTWLSIGSLTSGSWNEVRVTVPANAATPLSQLGLELKASSGWTGSVYVDSVSW